MKARCGRKTATNYKWYGAKGISYCEEWEQFQPFKDWALANGYADNLTLDRVNTNGNYAPNNCRWVSWKSQQNNRSTNRKITIDGETHTLAEWAEIVGINKGTISSRLYCGWCEYDAVMTPKKREGQHGKWNVQKRNPDRDERGRWKAARAALS